MDNERSVADQMNSGMFLAPDLIGEGSESPLLDQARSEVAEQAEHGTELEEQGRRAANGAKTRTPDR